MYDLEKDPSEMKSVYNDPTYTKVQKSTDVNYKLSKAVEYYNKKKYYQAIICN